MSKRLTLTQETIKDYIKSEKNRFDESLDECVAFEIIAAQKLLARYDLDDDETERGHVGKGNDGGYDGIYIFANECLITGQDFSSLDIPNNSIIDIHLYKTKYQTGFPEVSIQNWKDSFPNLLTDNPDPQRYNEEVRQAFELILSILKTAMRNKYRVNITFWGISLTTELHPNLIKQSEELKTIVQKNAPIVHDIAVNILTDKELFSAFQRSPDSVVSLHSDKDPLCPDGHSAILAVTIPEFNKFATSNDGNLEKSLFEANIRDYQGNNSVNKAIQNTLRNDMEVDFWWLNNGITILADSVKRDMDCSVTLINPRIVNGLQTSNEIWHYCREGDASKDTRKVLVKCISITDQDVRAKIIQATNNQSVIPSAYLRSLETIHLQIEQYFKRHGLHYERRKSSCKNEGIAAKDIITVPFLGQCLIAVLLKQPDYARARPAQILADDIKYKKIFNEDIPPEAYFALGKTSLFIRQYLRKSDLDRAEQNNLIFYVILATCAVQFRSFDITPNYLKNLNAPSVDALEDIVAASKQIFDDAGGDAKVAKSAEFAKLFIERFPINENDFNGITAS